MRPLAVSYGLWSLWALSWILAAVWSKPIAARTSWREEAVHRLPTAVGYILLFFGRGLFLRRGLRGIAEPMWRLGAPVCWALALAVAAGLAFTWWARVTLGGNWSGSVTRKEGHEIIERGPYALVRHPIYTGLIFASLAIAIQIGRPTAVLGFALLTLGFWLKARLEERFLRRELGEAAYDDYRRRTPMLIPGWPRGR